MSKCPICNEKQKIKKEKKKIIYKGTPIIFNEVYVECKNNHQLHTTKTFNKSHKNFKKKFKKII